MKMDPKFDKLMRTLIQVPKEEVQALAAAQSKPAKRPAKKKTAKKR